jgi:hypothetical protein
MQIENLSKEIDTQDMTAVRGGSNDSQVYVPIWTGVSQGNSNAVAGNLGPVQIDNNNSSSASTSVNAPTNYGAELSILLPVLSRLQSL